MARISLATLRRVLRFRRRELVAARVLIAAAGGLALLGALCYALSRAQPSWWKPGYATPTPEHERMATVLENAVVTEVSKARPSARGPGGTGAATGVSEPWAMLVRAEDINAWLNTKLPRWVSGDSRAVGPGGEAGAGGVRRAWPRQVQELQVEFEEGLVLVGVRIRGAGGDDQTLTTSLRPSVRDGQLWLEATGVSVGRMPIPVGLVFSSKASAGGSGLLDAASRVPKELRVLPETGQLMAALAGAVPVLEKATTKLQDGRRVRLLGVESHPSGLVLQCRTEGANTPK